tara:strand:+ start:308 stop:436 length:129 start_codon:yes stop_codon:yes gene_type:complete
MKPSKNEDIFNNPVGLIDINERIIKNNKLKTIKKIVNFLKKG